MQIQIGHLDLTIGVKKMNDELPTTITLRDGEHKLADLPTWTICLLLKRWSMRPMVTALAVEVQRRVANGESISFRVMAKANRENPPPCKCGRKGTRIVGRTTYCGHPKCLQAGVDLLKARGNTLDKAQL